MIVTVTMNPAIDKTAETDSLTPGGLNRLDHIVLDAGGKGINVSKMIAALNGSCVATGFLGGSAGREIESILRGLGIQTDFVPVRQGTRTNLKVLCKESGITEFNEPGAAVTETEMAALYEKLLRYAGPEVTFVFSGSIPEGVEPDIYRKLIMAVKEKGAAVFLDADGKAFSRALLAGPDFIKPNIFELLQYFEMEGAVSLRECAALCRRLTERGIGMVVLSMGSEGALFVSSQKVLYAPGIEVEALSTVGAGDSMAGALVYAFDAGMDLREAAALAMASSAGAVTTRGTRPPDRETVDALLKSVVLEELEIK